VNNYNSKKFIVIMISLIGSFILAFFGKMSPELAGIITVCVSVYNYVQGRIDERKDGSD